MAKVQHIIKLTGYTKDGIKANTQQSDQVVLFRNIKNSITVKNMPVNNLGEARVMVITYRNHYELIKHNSITNLYTGVLNNSIKAHFTKKRLVAKLIYWA